MPGDPASDPAPVRRILVRGVNWLGDAVMTTPALLRLRERFPEARVTLLTAEKLADLWRLHPAVNEVIPFLPGEGIFSISRKLRAGNFDLAVVLPNSPRSAIEVWQAGIPRRAGYVRPWRKWFLTQAISRRPGHSTMHKRSVQEIRRRISSPPDPSQNRAPDLSAHQVHEYLHLAAALGANPEPTPPRLFVAPDEVEAARKKFGLGESGAVICGLNPGAEYGPAKRWPAGQFIAAAREIQRRTGCTWLIFGGKGDLVSAGEIESGLRESTSAIRNLAGRTSLRELMSLFTLCRVLLTNDSGPMHVAAALGTPVVAPFGSTSPELTGPGLPGDPRHRLLKSEAPCSPCFLRECPIDFRCMKGIGVERVVASVLEVAGGGR